MLPCQKECPRFFAGCHKTCPDWSRFQAQQAELRRRVHQARRKQLQLYEIERMALRRQQGYVWR